MSLLALFFIPEPSPNRFEHSPRPADGKIKLTLSLIFSNYLIIWHIKEEKLFLQKIGSEKKEMNNVKVRKIRENARIPQRASNGAIGFDVYASIVLNKITKEIIGELPIQIEPGESVLIGIGVQFAISWPYEAQVRPRSGLACKHDIELSNSPGTIDPDFRGEAGVLLRNRGKKPFIVEEGMRIAQLIFS